jgi:hypothetical protein
MIMFVIMFVIMNLERAMWLLGFMIRKRQTVDAVQRLPGRASP